MLNSKNYIFVITPYLFFCCGLYQMTYWSLFDLDGLKLLSVTDIVKSAISPLIIKLISISLGFYVAVDIYSKMKANCAKNISDIDKKKIRQSVAPLIVVVLLICAIGVFVPNSLMDQKMLFTAMLIYIITDINWVFASDFNPVFDKRFLLMLLIYFPCITISEAFGDANKILENKSFSYTIVQSSKKIDTLKFIGLSNELFIFTTLKNEKNVFIKSDTITIYRK
jgi:hypothetical protein